MDFEVTPPTTAEFDAVGFGLNAVDHLCIVPGFPENDTKVRIDGFVRAGGGQAASAMVVCARFGLSTKYVGKVGGDEIGAFSLESIAREGVDVSDVIRVDGATNQIALIIVDARTGARTILWHRPRGIATTPVEITGERVATGRVLLLDGHDAPAAARAAEVARERGVPVVLDAETVKEGTRDLVAGTDVVVASSRFPSLYTGRGDRIDGLAAILDEGPSLAVATLGAEGAVAMDRSGGTIESPGFPVEAVDTTGAGDVFHGAFVFGMLSGWTVERTLRFSNAAAAMNCTAIGARAGVPGLAEVLRFMGEEARGGDPEERVDPERTEPAC